MIGLEWAHTMYTGCPDIQCTVHSNSFPLWIIEFQKKYQKNYKVVNRVYLAKHRISLNGFCFNWKTNQCLSGDQFYRLQHFVRYAYCLRCGLCAVCTVCGFVPVHFPFDFTLHCHIWLGPIRTHNLLKQHVCAFGVRFYGVACDQITWCQAINVRCL